MRVRRIEKLGSKIEALARHYLGGLYDRAYVHHIFLNASGMAFSLAICIIPMILIVFAVLGIILRQPSIATEISSFLDKAIPYPETADYIKEIVLSRVEEFRLHRAAAGTIGAIGLLLAATSLFSSMRTILNKSFEVPSEEPILIGKLRDLGLLVLVVVYFLLGTTVLPGWEVIKDSAHKVEWLQAIRFGAVEGIVLAIAAFCLVFCAFALVYFLVPYERPPKKVVLVSALWAAVLWEIAKQLFGFYITHFVTLRRVYGAYALLVVAAFWIYYTSIVFIIGAEIGQLYRKWKERQAAKVESLFPNSE